MDIARPFYLDKLIARRENGAIKVITGIRRCGKTYLLYSLYGQYLRNEGIEPGQIIEISLDDERFSSLRDPANLLAYVNEKVSGKPDMHYVFIDEVQYAITHEELRDPNSPPRVYGALNGMLRFGNADVYVTGSNSRFLSSDVLTEFRGRGDEVRVHPLSFSEYHPAHSGDFTESWADYVAFGGLPRILSQRSIEAKERYLDNLLSEVYLRDIEERYDLRGNVALGNVLDVLASATSSLTNPSNIANTFKSKGMGNIDDKTVRKYIDCLKDAFLVEEVHRYDVKGRKHIGSPYKYYFEDLGLRNARLNFRQQEETHLMENAIYNELLGRGYHVDVGVVYREEKDSAGKRMRKALEIDFVCNMASQRYYIQSAFSIPDAAKMEQEQASLVRSGDSFKKIIVVKDRLRPYHNNQGILVLGLQDFLLEPDAINW